MKLNVHVLGQHVAVFEQVGDFKSVMSYVPNVTPENLVSLTMPRPNGMLPLERRASPYFPDERSGRAETVEAAIVHRAAKGLPRSVVYTASKAPRPLMFATPPTVIG
jgi:hypothetical protein